MNAFLTYWLRTQLIMTYYILKKREFSRAALGSPDRTLYLMKKEDIPATYARHILRLQCSSIQIINGISSLMQYLSINTADSLYVVQPYILKKITWGDAINLFGFDQDTDQSDLEIPEIRGSSPGSE